MVYSGSLLYRKVLSPFYDKLVTFIPAWIHPNMVTLIGGVCALFATFAADYDMRWAACILFTLYHMCDNADGKHARATKQSSEFGAILDHFIDGTVGIWAGTVGIQKAINISPYHTTIGIFLFTTLFYIVHTVHAFSGFFEIGGEYLSIDEAFLFISAMYALWALDITNPPVLSDELCHKAILGLIAAICVAWIVQHGPKVSLSRMKSRPLILLPGIIYFSVMLFGGGLQKCIETNAVGTIIAAFAIPYGIVLWESKDKH